MAKDAQQATPEAKPGASAREGFAPIAPEDLDWLIAFAAHKDARIRAERVPPGTRVETVMADGHVETAKTAGPEGGYKVTNPNGEQYLVDPKKFGDRYESDGLEGTYKPKFLGIKTAQVEQNVAFTAPWGEQMYIKAGGWLIKTREGEIYGIQPDEFRTTYKLDPSVMRDFNLAARGAAAPQPNAAAEDDHDGSSRGSLRSAFNAVCKTPAWNPAAALKPASLPQTLQSPARR